MADWAKDKNINTGGREHGKPHIDYHANFRLWHQVFQGKDFQKKLEEIKARVVEFFRFNGKEEKYYKFLPSYIDHQGNKFPPQVDAGVEDPRNPGKRYCPEWYGVSERGELTTQMMPMCVQISFKHKDKNCCANINFHQNNEEFKKECAYYLKIDWTRFFLHGN